MILNEIKTINETKFLHTWSDRDMLIKQVETGILYEDAMDLVDADSGKAKFSYEETDLQITRPDEDEDESD